MTDDRYNGYTNRETWAASLHLSNDEWLYNLATETMALDNADRLKEVVMDLVEVNRDAQDSGASPGEQISVVTMMDREVGSWWRVDWNDVAEGFAE